MCLWIPLKAHDITREKWVYSLKRWKWKWNKPVFFGLPQYILVQSCKRVMFRLSYHLQAAASACCGPHNKVICPSRAREPPLNVQQPLSSRSCPKSLSRTSRKSQLQTWWWQDGRLEEWREGRFLKMEKKVFVLEKMSRLAFKLSREMEVVL